MARILVTGATGFIGGALVRQLVAQQQEVRVLRRAHSVTSLLDDLPITHCLGDICDRHSIDKAIEGCEQVFHTAGNVSFWHKDKEWQYEVNVLGTQNMVEAALKEGVQRFVHTSSVSALGYPDPPGYIGHEETAYNWGSLDIGYNRTKYLAELEVLKGVEKGLEAVIVNPGTVFGAGDINFNAGSYIQAIAQGQLIGYPSGGTTVIDIDTVVYGHLKAAENGQVGERYILGSHMMTYKEIFDTIAKVVGVPAPGIPIPPLGLFLFSFVGTLGSFFTHRQPLLTREMAQLATMKLFYSGEKAQQAFALPQVPFRVSVERAYTWYRDQRLL